MPRFAANLSMLFQELPLIERFAAAARAGFTGVEILFPCDHPADEMRQQLIEHDLAMVLVNNPPRNWAGGERGFAAVPGAEERFRADFERVLNLAEVLKPLFIHVLAGLAKGPDARRTYVNNLTWAAARARGQSLTIEPLNPVSMPGYFLNDFDMAAKVLDEVAAANLSLQFDAFHAQAITGDAVGCWQQHRAVSRHVQIAAFPGRGEPDRGEVDYPAFFAMLDASGYEGWVSAEYTPRTTTQAGLGWLPV